MPERLLRAIVLCALLAVDVSTAVAAPQPNGLLLVGAATDHYPYSYLDPNNTLTGFAVDLFDEVARVGGLRFRRITGKSADLNRRFFAGEFPVAQLYAYSRGREGPTLFSAPYLTLKGALFVRRSAPRIGSVADLAGRTVIVGRGSTGEEFLKRTGLAVTLVPVDTADASLEMLARGQYDAALTSRLTGMAIIARSGYDNLLPAGPPIDDLTVSLCFASHDVDRLVQINEGLAILYRTGDYERIYRRWFARYEPTSFTAQDLAHYAAGVLFVVALGALWMSWHQRRLSSRVAEQARTLETMDSELAQSRRLRAVGEMVGGIAHEFNNLLTPIVLKVELLREERESDPALQRELEVISGAADRAATLTRRLLTFGRKVDHEPAHVHLSEIVAANVDLVLPTCDSRLAIVVDVPAQLPALFQNRADLHQVVLNLLMNARDTLHEKVERNPAAEATVTVRVEALPPSGRGPAGGQRLSVRDTGVGMPPEVIERIFEPFFSTKEVGRGTGLGLATVWHLVQACGGRIEVDSTPGVGTVFRVDFPRQSPPSEQPADPS